MTGQIIDHAVSFIAFILIFMVTLGAFNGIIVQGLNYVNLRQTTLVANDLIDNMLLTPGSPANWGQMNVQPSAFGLQNPGFKAYSISPFDPLRMMQPNGTIIVNGVSYSTFILPGGQTMWQPTTALVNYTTAQQLLGLSGSYGFRLTVTPTLTVAVTTTNLNPLTLSISVTAPGGPVYNANIGFTLFYIPSTNLNGNNPPPVYSFFAKFTTNTVGQATVTFPFDSTSTAFSGIATVSAGGMLATQMIGNTNFSQVKMFPVLQNIATGAGEMIHECTYQNNPPCGIYNYNASLYIPAADGSLQQISLGGGTGSVTPGQPGAFQFPLGQPGIVVIGFKGPGLAKGAGFFVLPWGYNTLSLSLFFGGTPPTVEVVASVRRAALMGTIHYQVVLTVWKASS